jgi:hypothetical protein
MSIYTDEIFGPVWSVLRVTATTRLWADQQARRQRATAPPFSARKGVPERDNYD